ncbi:Mth938-like domain-containing protein [Rhodovulum sp. DZ06]|uniref:Mth938-like domain-containing protein n=1 Tax=Rhodovulum sp. DZ06 TaxID=3425126 RepID=UPI003D346398
MQMNEISFAARPPLDSYGEGGFSLGGVRHVGSLALLPTRMEDWAAKAPGEVTAEALAPFIEAAGEIDVLLIGMGGDIAFPAPGAREALEAAGIGFDLMSTAAACRTYNVLLAEDRRVAAALIAV